MPPRPLSVRLTQNCARGLPYGAFQVVACRMARNVAGKKGPKGKTAGEKTDRLDEVKLWEQWWNCYEEFHKVDKVVKRRGRFTTSDRGNPTLKPAVELREKLRRSLESLSKALLTFSPPEEVEEVEGVVKMDFEKPAVRLEKAG